MSTLNETVAGMLKIDGAAGAAILDTESGMTLAQGASMVPLEVVELVAASTINVLRAYNEGDKTSGGGGGAVESVIAHYPTNIGFVRVLAGDNAGLAMLLMLDRKTGNQALANHKLGLLEAQLTV